MTAREQSAGRGRQGRRWQAEPESALLASLVLRGVDERSAMLPLAAAVAVCEACESVAAVSCAIKWPNDVWLDRRKVAGILVEGRPQAGWAVLGVGVNLSTPRAGFAADLADTAASLGLDPADTRASERLLGALLEALALRLEEEPARVLAAWSARDALRGARIRFDQREGVAAGIDDEGSLLVDTDGGRLALDSGEVHLGPMPRRGRASDG